MSKPKKFYGVKRPIPLTRRRKDFKFIHHECNSECSTLENKLLEDNPTKFRVTDDAILMYDHNPFLVPLFLEFKRKNDDEDDCGYLTPCGVELYSYEEIYRYLKVSNSKLNVNQFNLSARIELFREHSYFRVYAMKRDISNGVEATPIQMVNEFEPEFYLNFTYIKEREFAIDTDLIKTGDLKSCDCEDDCSDSSKCACRQLTVTEHRALYPNTNKAGYEFNHLLYQPKTAIYECNSKCKCKKNCLNRVTQNGIKAKLQVYKTSNRGFGVRALHDLPRGTFVCSYEGKIVKNTRTRLEDDNPYLMNLSYDYCYKNLIKERRESGQAPNKQSQNKSNSNESNQSTGNESNQPNLTQTESQPKESNENEGQQTKKGKKQSNEYLTIHDLTETKDLDLNYDSDSSFSDLTVTDLSDSSISDDDLKDLFKIPFGCYGVINRSLPDTANEDETNKNDDLNEPIRKKLRKEENNEPNQQIDSDYLIDARERGNVSRFINHSCNPNLAAQPIFIELQDPLFVNFAFFTTKDVKAYSELTFDYFYGDEEAKMNFDCSCRSKKCIKKSRNN